MMLCRAAGARVVRHESRASGVDRAPAHGKARVLIPLAALAIMIAVITTVRSQDDGDAAHPSLASRVSQLLEEGKVAEAEQLARDALTRAEAENGAESDAVGIALDAILLFINKSSTPAGPEALEFAQRSLAIKLAVHGSDSAEYAASLHNLATVQMRLGRHEEAETGFRKALRLRERHLGAVHRETAGTLGNLSNLLRRQGKLDEALALAERALTILERLEGPDSLDVTGALNSLGGIHWRLGNLPEARSLLERSLNIRRARLPADHTDVTKALNNLGTVLNEMGDFGAARPLLEEALEVQERTLGPEHPELANGLVNLGNLLDATGEQREARRLYLRALEIEEKELGPEHPYLASTLNDLCGVEYILGELVAARADCERALGINRKIGATSPGLPFSLDNLALVLVELGETKAAEELEREALRVREASLGVDHANMAYSLTTLGSISATRGDFDAARIALERALTIRQRRLGPEHPETAHSMNMLARLAWLAGKPEEAVTTALRAEGSMREQLVQLAPALSEREALRFEATRILGLDLALSGLVSGMVPDGLTIPVYEEVIRSRALVLDLVAARHRATLETDSPRIVTLVNRLEEARQDLARLVLSGYTGPDGEVDARKLAEARAARDRAERELARATGRHEPPSDRTEATLASVQEALPSGAALLSYVQFERMWPPEPETRPVSERTTLSYMAMVARADRAPSVVYLGTAEEIDARVARWRHEASRAPGSVEDLTGYREAATALRRAVWDPVAPLLAKTTLVLIVPDGALNLVNLAALPDESGAFILEDDRLIHHLSAERDVLRGEVHTPGRGLLAIGGPDFDRREADHAPEGPPPGRGTFRGSRSACEDFRTLRFQPLPGAAMEAEEVASLWRTTRPPRSTPGSPGDVVKLTGSAASEAAFKASAPGRRILHIATHGFFLQDRCASLLSAWRQSPGDLAPAEPVGENPLLLSGLAFAGANRAAGLADDRHHEDGILSAEEVSALDLRGVEWVVLSACDTGLGDILSGEGVLGLRRTFAVAGAVTLMMSLWPVEDQEAREWVRHLYRARLNDGLSTAASVRRASLRMLEAQRRAGVEPHPYVWGAFVAAGSWR